ncbi:MAG TPA: POTRA domain-containing protein [Terriglobia bacterium]|nr:POTRA domain-containing protein [Terriglobia bacterium]
MTRQLRTRLRTPSFACSPESSRRPRLAPLAVQTIFLFVAAAVQAIGARAAAPESLWGRTVVEVRLEGDADLHASDFAAQITQQKGEPLDSTRVASSLKNLYSTGRFVELTADAAPQGQGAVLIFRAKFQYFIGVVRVDQPPKGVDPATLASASGLRLGQSLSEEALTRAQGRIVTLLASSAYYDAQVQVKENRHPESQEADVIFTVIAGPAARLKGVDFTGDPRFPAATLLRESGWKPGIHLTSLRLERGLSRIRSFYAKQDHLQASVNTTSRTYVSRTNTERLTLRVDAGPQIRIRVAGAKVSASTLRDVLPAYRQASADEITLLQGERALQNYFELKGRYNVKVKLQPRGSPGPQGNLDIVYAVDLGPRGEFVGYRFRGNHALTTDDLTSAVPLQPAAAFASQHGNFSPDLLDRSVQALTDVYASHGFLDASISTALDENFEGHPNRLFVTFNITEGVQTQVSKVTIEGLSPEVEKQVRLTLIALRGAPYSPERARADRDSILTYLSNHGFSQATVDLHASEPSAAHQVDLDYHVNSGPQQTIRRVVVLGNQFTRDSVIDRQLAIQPGQALNESALLQTQQRLYDLGLFNQVQISTQNPDTPEPGKTVVVGLEEAKRWTLGYGGGMDVQQLPGSNSQGKYGVSPRVALEVDRINLDGRPQTFSLGGHYSNLEKIGSTSYGIPGFLNHPGLDFRVSVVADQSRNVLTFNSRRQEVSVTIQKQFSSHASLLARYNFRHVTVSNLEISPGSIPLLSQGVLVATVGGGYVNDHRDNPVDATRGSYSSVDADVAWTRLGSSADFGRVIGQNSTYYRLGSHVILARNTRLGLEPTFGQTSPANGVPLPERFFMGGADSDRAFALNQAGPRDPITGFPLGGRALFLNQVELRFPFARNRLGFVLFEDAGNVFSTYRRLKLLKFTQNSPSDLDYDVQAGGIGVRYQTPVGPLRFDVAYSPNVPQYYACSNPNVSLCSPSDVEVLRLPRVQFVLSIGQSF